MTGSRGSFARVRRLEQVADLAAGVHRARLLQAAREVHRVSQAIATLDARRDEALKDMSNPDQMDVVGPLVSASWLRWAEGERRRNMIALAAARAKADELRKEAALAIARHSALQRLIERGR